MCHQGQVLTSFVFPGSSRIPPGRSFLLPSGYFTSSSPGAKMTLSSRAVRSCSPPSPSSRGPGAPCVWKNTGTHGCTSSMGHMSTSSRCLMTRSVSSGPITCLREQAQCVLESSGLKSGLESWRSWVQILPLLLTSWITSSNSEPQFSHLQNGDVNSFCPRGLNEGWMTYYIESAQNGF